MSRIGKLPVAIPQGVSITVNEENTVIVKGPLGELSQEVNPEITITINDSVLVVGRPSESKEHKSLHGLYRSLINNMVEGVLKGYEIKQEFVGVGYTAEVKGQVLEMALGFSHKVVFKLPVEVKAEAVAERRQAPVLTLKSHDKQLLGLVASKIRSLRKPEPYKGKGIKFVGEQIRRKAGKTAGK